MRQVNIEVYHDGGEVFGVLSRHTSDLPKPLNQPIQEWVSEHFNHLESGDSVENAGVLKYEPNGEIINIEKK